MASSHSKNVLLGISGSIAAYKTADLISLLKKHEIPVQCLLTQNAQYFVSPLVLETLSENPTQSKLFDEKISGTEHIRLARWADVFVLAPATANLIAKIALGLADDLITTIALAIKAPLIIAPAMNTSMWENPIIQTHVQNLKQRGVIFIEPDIGELACGEQGIGKLANIETIANRILNILNKPPKTSQETLKGKTILITAGPTISFIDKVRYMTNPSTGKMGNALATEALRRGAKVLYVLGIDKGVIYPTPPRNAENRFQLIPVKTAKEMLDKSKDFLKQANGVIATAAVLDYEAKNLYSGKLKRTSKPMTLELVPTVDVLSELKAIAKKMPKRTPKKTQWFFGFAAETDALKENAKLKFHRKNLDFLFANTVSKDTSTGFGSETNGGWFFCKKHEPVFFDVISKEILAQKLLDHVAKEVWE
ncbi:bifunctional phosphopantothenoylcysteine decarboxylase/phosphopantothenate--cysteine ligase CoaBC [Candidatus Nomurabacteria bacterium]|nr:bifunctional phosphopantothenoylcysteine decarboxylase/phosphopantothenate--cysteine ligase CoaBC [Candidatus Nomurabacteria bacterium]